MKENKQAIYSIQDAFKSLDMVEDERVVVIEEPNSERKILSEKIEEVKIDSSIEIEEDLDEVNARIDAEIEAFTENLRRLKEKYDRNPESLTSDEMKQLRESSIIEELKPETETINEEQKIKLTDKEQVQQGIDELNQEKSEDEIEMVVDVEAETVDELKDSYVGNFIIQCPVCKTLVYKAEEEIIPSEEDETIVNIEESCPHCKSEEGFAVIGKVAPVEIKTEEEPEEESAPEEEPVSEPELEKEPEKSETEEDEEEEEVQNESLDFMNLDLEDLNEELFNRLATKYLNNIYENVDNFTTESGEVNEDDNKITLEGIINFKSGKKMPTKFVFEAKSLTKKGRVRFIGLNESLSTSKRTFTLVGRVVEKVLMPESLTYNYSVRVDEELKRIYGRVTEDLSKFKKE